jgi:hypothetical protein
VLWGLHLPLAACSMVLQAWLHCFIMQCLSHFTICRPVALLRTRCRVVPFVSFFPFARSSRTHHLSHAHLAASAVQAATLVLRN